MIIKDPRVNYEKNSEFLDMMERYYAKTSEKYFNGEALQEHKPE